MWHDKFVNVTYVTSLSNLQFFPFHSKKFKILFLFSSFTDFKVLSHCIDDHDDMIPKMVKDPKCALILSFQLKSFNFMIKHRPMFHEGHVNMSLQHVEEENPESGQSLDKFRRIVAVVSYASIDNF